jgi:type VI secretion system secreted protein VgrG
MIHRGDADASQAQVDLGKAYDEVAGLTPTRDLTGQDLGGLILTAGVYFFSSSAQLTDKLTLDFQGNPDAEFYFQIGSTLTTASNSSVLFANGFGDSCNVFWQVGSSATLGTGTAFQGNILALTSITLTTRATIEGRALARNGAVTLDSNTITAPDCAAPSAVPEPASLALMGIGGLGMFGGWYRKRGNAIATAA